MLRLSWLPLTPEEKYDSKHKTNGMWDYMEYTGNKDNKYEKKQFEKKDGARLTALVDSVQVLETNNIIISN